MAGDRSVSDVLQDILRNVQEILRSEVRLAKAEIRQEATEAAASALWMTAGVVGVLSAWMFLLWTAAYALCHRPADVGRHTRGGRCDGRYRECGDQLPGYAGSRESRHCRSGR